MTYEIVVSFILLFLAIFLFSTEKIRIDLAAILIMILLPWTGIITPVEAFSGFSSNAVVTIMAVMILGYGIESSGSLNFIADYISLKAGGEGKKVMVWIAASVGIISSFMQNIGAVALFLPVTKKIGKNTAVSSRRLLMPMGFAGILGGTLTMIASSPLIILNDFLVENSYEELNFFSVTPVGILLLTVGILFFYYAWDKILPGDVEEDKNREDIQDIYNLPKQVIEIEITENSPLIGKTIEEIELWIKNKVHILAIWDSGSITYTPWRKTRFTAKQRIAVFGKQEHIKEFHQVFNLDRKSFLYVFHELNGDETAGFAEIIVPPKSSLIGKSIEEIGIRKNFKIEPITYVNPEGERLDLIERPMEAGLQIIVFGLWEDIRRIKESREFVVITDVKQVKRQMDIKKRNIALLSLALSILLVIFGFSLPLSFFTGAIIMVLSGVIPKEDIYKAVDWKTVFLLAALIPLGLAFEKSGAAELTADIILGLISSWHVLGILLVIGIVTGIFSLFMSNAAAAVLMVPIVLIMAPSLGVDPRYLALFTALSASNSFILPTHQVNAYIKTPGKYSNFDFIKVGGLMSFIFLSISTLMFYIFYI